MFKLQPLWGLDSQDARDQAMWNNLECFRLCLDEVEARLTACRTHEDRKKAFALEEFKITLVRELLYGHPDRNKLLSEEELQLNLQAFRIALDRLRKQATAGTRVIAVAPYFRQIECLDRGEVERIANTTSTFPANSAYIGEPDGWFRLALYLIKKCFSKNPTEAVDKVLN